MTPSTTTRPTTRNRPTTKTQETATMATTTTTPTTSLDYDTALATARGAHDADVAQAVAAGDADALVALRASMDSLPLTVAVEVLGNLRHALGAAETEVATAEEAVQEAVAEREAFSRELAHLQSTAEEIGRRANPPGIQSRTPAEREVITKARAEYARAQAAAARLDMTRGPGVDRAVRTAEEAARPHRRRVEELSRAVKSAERRVRSLLGA